MITRCLYIEAKIKDAGCMFLISQDPFDKVHTIKSQDQESNNTLFVLIRKETPCCKLVPPNSTKILLIKTTDFHNIIFPKPIDISACAIF